jgi:hypothetical protein
VDEDNFFDRPIHTLAFENGIEETTDDDENKSSELSSPVVPNKNADHDRLPEELKKHQIGQSIQQYAGDVESEPETFHTESVTDLRQKDVEDDDEHSHSSDDETLHGSHEDDTDEDCEAVKAVQYQFDSKDVYKVKRTHKKKDEFQQELNEYIRRRSDNEENAKEVRAAVEQFDKEQQEAATRPYSSQVANYGADDRTEDIRIGHGAAPVEPKRRTSVKRKEQQVAKEKEDNGREVTVHTSLHDTVGRYSTFEPDRQETIRNEIGNLLNIRDLMGHFEKGGAEKAPRPWTRRTVQESTFVPLFTPDDIKRMSIDDLTHSIKEDHHEHVHHPPAAHHLEEHHDHGHHVAPRNFHLDLSQSEVILEEQKSVGELRSKFGHTKHSSKPTHKHTHNGEKAKLIVGSPVSNGIEHYEDIASEQHHNHEHSHHHGHVHENVHHHHHEHHTKESTIAHHVHEHVHPKTFDSEEADKPVAPPVMIHSHIKESVVMKSACTTEVQFIRHNLRESGASSWFHRSDSQKSLVNSHVPIEFATFSSSTCRDRRQIAKPKRSNSQLWHGTEERSRVLPAVG